MKKILIVEDERILAISLKMDLNDAGFQEISIVSNGDDAFCNVQQGNTDLILMDISIQGEKSGIDTANMISMVSEVPIIYLTGETDIETMERAKSVRNCKGYLSKPVKMDQLQPLLVQTFSMHMA